MSVHFTLSDVDPEIPPQKEVIRINGSSFKPFSTHFLSKKRKVEELYDLDNPASNLLMAADIMIDKYTEKVETIDDLIATHKKSSLKLEKAKRKIEVLKAMLAKKSGNANEEGLDANNTLMEEVKKDAAIAVLESKILMAMEAAENGQDTSMWDVKGWRDRLARMKEDHAPNPFFIGLGGSKAPKRKATKAPKMRVTDTMIKGEASNSKDDEDMAVADDAVDSEETSGEDGI